MGATFESLIPKGERDLTYSTVHEYRVYLMRMFGEDVALKYERIISDLMNAGSHEELKDADDRFIELMDSLKGEYAYGVRAFVNHPDSSGFFGEHECKYIAEAFYALLKTDIVTDEDERDIIEELADLFMDTYDADGIVMIW